MARYIKAVECADIISERFNIPLDDLVDVFAEIPTADVAPKSEVDMSQHLLKDAWKRIEELDNLCGELQKAKAEVARTFRKRMNEKMGKHTHLLGKEYVQRIMREVEKELIGEEDA